MGTKLSRAKPVESVRLRSASALQSRFRSRRRLAGGRHWVVYAADRRDGAYLLVDASRLALLLRAEDQVLLGGLIDVLRFASPEARDAYARSRRWG